MDDHQKRLNELISRADKLREDISETLTPTQSGADALGRALFRAGDLLAALKEAKTEALPWET